VPSLDEIARLVAAEVDSIDDVTTRDALRALLVAPEPHQRNWDYGIQGETLECWFVAKEPTSDTALVYSEHGFGPKCPWGLVFLSDNWFGMDSGWFRHLEEAFVESYPAFDLPIWNVVERTPEGPKKLIAESLTGDDAFARQRTLNAKQVKPTHHVVYRGSV